VIGTSTYGAALPLVGSEVIDKQKRRQIQRVVNIVNLHRQRTYHAGNEAPREFAFIKRRAYG
jgi:hypothetical protein